MYWCDFKIVEILGTYGNLAKQVTRVVTSLSIQDSYAQAFFRIRSLCLYFRHSSMDVDKAQDVADEKAKLEDIQYIKGHDGYEKRGRSRR